MLKNKTILLIVSGGIAAYKAAELVRLLKAEGVDIRCVLTESGAQFITPLTLGALSGNPVYTDLFSLTDETEMGHIRLSREADLVLVAPASANIMAKAAYGLADDLASTVLLASDKPVMMAPAMNPLMWNNPATQANIDTLKTRGVHFTGPCEGEMACGETGSGRMTEPEDIVRSLAIFFESNQPLRGKTALVTSGPTHEPLDPVRFIGNRSSGKQGHAIAQALANAGADVTLVSGPVDISDPMGVKTIHIETAAQMMGACSGALPADIAVCAAAVGDWTVSSVSDRKIKKQDSADTFSLTLSENEDILARLSASGPSRPELVIGFAAETEDLLKNARMKREKKGCDWILANAIDREKSVFGAQDNHVYFVTADKEEDWEHQSKKDVAKRLTQYIVDFFQDHKKETGTNDNKHAGSHG